MPIIYIKILALIFVFTIPFSCFMCKSEFIQLKAGELSINGYYLHKTGKLVPFNNAINRTIDTLNINLKQNFYNVAYYGNNNGNLMACSPSDAEYLDRPDYISVTTLGDFDNQTIAKSNINHLCKLFGQHNHSIEPLSNFKFDRGYDEINICLIKNPTVDSIKLNIKLFFEDVNLVRSVETKWLKFN